MNVPLLILLPFKSLLRNKTRSFLTMLGMVIGIASVIAMVAIGEGASRLVESQVRSLGSNMILITPAAIQQSGVSLGSGSRMNLTPEDAEAIRRSVPGVKAVSPVVQARGQLIYGDRNWAPQSIRGEGEDYLAVKDWDIVEGAFFGADDVLAARKVCVIGSTVAENLFEDESPVGKNLRIQNMPFRVLGVLGRKGSSPGGEDQDDVVIVPWTTAKRVLRGSRFNNLDVVLVSSTEEGNIPEVEKDVTDLLRDRHRLGSDQDEDFRTLSMNEMLEASTRTTRIMTTLLACIASISLIVGGVGIMNIMLVSVTERTREIGLRMAVGARRTDILRQFLSEGVLIALIGGLLGMTLGGASTQLVRVLFHWPIFVSPEAVLLAFGSSSLVGVFFGFYPSFRASRLDPIAALRNE
ncbi:MAG: ABC transporter permease [Planctomycetaceae bacterium]|nr:ABC transporter permease [Planctomycetaceae bacterium]